jgi:single-stranded DNA-binding protein
MIKATIVGRVGQVRFAERGGDNPFQVLSFTVASNATTRKGTKVPNWATCKLWGPRAKQLSSHLVKGQGVAVSGRPEARAYQGKEAPGAELVVHVVDFEFVGAKPKGTPEAVTGEPAPENATE